jgi:hypothetical protein
VADVGPDRERHREAEDVQRWRDHPRPTHPEETAEDANGDAEENQEERINDHIRDRQRDTQEM